MTRKYSIIGNSAAGIAAIRTIRRFDQDATIVCYSDESEPPYNKCFLADYLGKEKSEEQTYTLTPEHIERFGVDMRLGKRVCHIASDNKTVMLSDGTHESYDALLLASGTRPIWPPILGLDGFKNVFSFHNLHDASRLYSYVQEHKPKTAVVIGSGLSGLEAADALHVHGVKTTVVEREDQVLKRHIPVPASAFLIDRMQQYGVQVLKASTISRVAGCGNKLNRVYTQDGTEHEVDLVVVATGLKQNIELAHDAGIIIGSHGIQVDDHLQTSIDGIYAAGDVIETIDTLSGKKMASCTWPDAMQQGMHAAMAMTGNAKPYKGATMVTSSAFFGFKFFSCGLLVNTPSSYCIKERSGQDYYHRYVFDDDILKGFCLIGNTQQYAKLRRAVMMKQPFTI